MVVKTTSFDDNPGGAAAYNAEAEEINCFDYRITARLNEPAEAVVFLRDVDGSLAQKYNDDSRDVYIGPGRLKIENPAATTIYDGRIHKAVHNKFSNTLTLSCRDWLSQLMDDRKNRDMREPLDGSGLRQSIARADVDNAKYYLRKGVVRTLWSAQADDGGAVTDETAEANDLTEDDMTLMPALPVVNDAYYFGFESAVSQFIMYISTQGAWAGDLTWEYWDGDSWEDILKVDSGNSKWLFENVVGEYTFAFTIPGDPWATVAVNGVTAYWIRARVSVFTGITTQPLGRNAWAEFYLYDDGEYDDDGGMAFVNDVYNGMKLAFTTGMAGKKTWQFFPWNSIATNADIYGDDPEAVWVDNDILDSGFANNDWELEYQFQTNLGNNTPSDFYVHDSITAVRLCLVWRVAETAAGNHVHLEIYDNNAADWVELDRLDESDHRVRSEFTVPVNIVPFIVDSTGQVRYRFNLDRTGGNITVEVFFACVFLDVTTTGSTSVITITDTQNPNRLQIPTDLTETTPASCLWDEVPYCIVQEAYKHIDSAESPGDLVTDGGGEVSLSGPDPLVALTSAAGIEHTSGISLRRYEERTELEMLQDLSRIDKTAFWMAIGTVVLTWKSTFNDGAPAALTDTDVISWNSGEYNFDPVYNEMHLYGPKTGGVQSVYDTVDGSPDPGVDSKVRYGVSRSNVVKNTGTTNEFELTELGEALVERDEDVNLFLNADIRGLSDLRLGDEVSITSTYLGLTAVKYVITFWEYAYLPDRTTIRLHPRNSTKGFVPHAMFGDNIRRVFQADRGERIADTFIPIPESTTS